MPPKKQSSSVAVKSRLLSKSLAQRLELVEEAVTAQVPETPDVVVPSEPIVKTPPPTIPKSVVIVEKPREAMINQGIQVVLTKELGEGAESPPVLIRVGVERYSGSLFHCILRAIYPPYTEWDRERRIRKVKEFRQDLAANFDGYYLRLDQAKHVRPSLQTCKGDLESYEGPLSYDYMDYLSKVINKVIVFLTVTSEGCIKAIPGNRIYGRQTHTQSMTGRNSHQDTKTSSPITYAKAEPFYIFILHLGGQAYELLCWRRKGRSYTLFPESHAITKRILDIVTQQ